MAEEIERIKTVLMQFQAGYALRKIEMVDSFMEDLFA